MEYGEERLGGLVVVSAPPPAMIYTAGRKRQAQTRFITRGLARTWCFFFLHIAGVEGASAPRELELCVGLPTICLSFVFGIRGAGNLLFWRGGYLIFPAC